MPQCSQITQEEFTIIKNMVQNDYDIKSIRTITGRSARAIRRIRSQKVFKNGREDLKRGPKPKLNNRKLHSVKRFIFNNPFCSIKDIVQGIGVQVSVSTMRRFMKRCGFTCGRPNKRPILNQSHKNKRLKMS